MGGHGLPASATDSSLTKSGLLLQHRGSDETDRAPDLRMNSSSDSSSDSGVVERRSPEQKEEEREQCAPATPPPPPPLM